MKIHKAFFLPTSHSQPNEIPVNAPPSIKVTSKFPNAFFSGPFKKIQNPNKNGALILNLYKKCNHKNTIKPVARLDKYHVSFGSYSDDANSEMSSS